MTISQDIRILYVIGELATGGAERHLAMVLPRLRSCGIEPAVYTLEARGELADALEAAGVPVLTVWGAGFLSRMPRIVRLTLSFATLLAVILRRRPSVIHMFLPAAYLVGGLASLLTRIPHRIMSRRSLNHYQLHHPLSARIERRLHSRMEVLLGNSTRVVDDLLAEGAPPKRVRKIYNGVAASAFPIGSAREACRQRIRTNLGIDSDDVVIICVANLFFYKGHVDLIEAFGVMEANCRVKWHLLCVGRDAGMRRALEAQVAALRMTGCVHFLGQRDDVEDLLAASDVGVLASYEEGFSNAVIEGMAAGLPMVVTDVGGNPEAIVDGECGYVVPSHNPEALACALSVLLSDPGRRAAMGSAGRARMEKHFSLDACVSTYEHLYKSVCTR